MTHQPGSIVLCHGKGVISTLIRFGQWIRHPRRTHFWEWNHVALIDDRSEGEDPYVIQATARGVTDTALLSSVAPGGRYVVVPVPEGVCPELVLGFAKEQVGVRYGFLTIASIAFNLLTPSFLRIDVRRSGTWICSALGWASLMAGGFLEPSRDIYQEKPADVAEVLGVGSSSHALAAYLNRRKEQQ